SARASPCRSWRFTGAACLGRAVTCSKYIQMGGAAEAPGAAEALARVVALRCVSLAEDHDPLSLRLVGDDVWCGVCRVQMPALDVMAHLKGTGSPWWVTGHRRRRHET